MWQLEDVWRKLYLQLRSVHFLLSFFMLGRENVKAKCLKLKIKSCWLTPAYFVQWHHLETAVMSHHHSARPAVTVIWHRSVSSYTHKPPLSSRHCMTIKSYSYCTSSQKKSSKTNGSLHKSAFPLTTVTPYISIHEQLELFLHAWIPCTIPWW